jgi:GNAT superfamily N-acetyltransferase
MHRLAVDLGYLSAADRTDEQVAESWARYRGMVEFLDAQPERRYLIAENGRGPVAFARVVRFGAMEQLTDLMVSPSHQGQGIGRRLLEQIWPGDPSPSLGRLVVATGAPRDLSLYTDFGVMPVAGHWHMRQDTATYLGLRSQETDATEAGWVSGEGDIGPAVARTPGQMIAVILAALDRVAKTMEPPFLGVYVSTVSWHLLHRLRLLGFGVYWPSWIMCSVPLPGLDRYVPTRPPFLL